MKNNLVKRSLTGLAAVVLSATCGAVAPVAGVHAEEGENNVPAIWIQVSPVSNRVVLSAGEELSYVFNVSNRGSEDFTVKVYAAPYYAINEQYDADFVNQTARTQISRWLSFRADGSEDEFKNEITFDVATEDHQSIEYKIDVPADIPAGGQYAAIVTEYVPKADSNASGVQTVPRVNTIIYASTNGNTVESAEVVEHNLPGFLTSGNIGVSSLVRNNGNTDFIAKYEFKVESLLGQSLYERDYSYEVLPETSRRVDFSWEDTPALLGIYKVNSTITALDQTSVQSKIVLKMPLFAMIIMLILLTSLIIGIIILVRKRQARRSRVIV